MIINNTYFVGKLHISQVGENASTKVNNNNSLQWFIDEYEVELMEKALGKKLANELFTNINPDTGEVIDNADQKWKDLVNGVTYTKNGVEFFWRGLKYTTGVLKRSLIANYVYYHYMINGKTQISTMGAVAPEAENATKVSIVPKLVEAWNEMIEWYGMPYSTKNNAIVITKRHGVIVDYFNGEDKSNVSLKTYLSDHEADFEDYHFTTLYVKNQLQL